MQNRSIAGGNQASQCMHANLPMCGFQYKFFWGWRHLLLSTSQVFTTHLHNKPLSIHAFLFPYASQIRDRDTQRAPGHRDIFVSVLLGFPHSLRKVPSLVTTSLTRAVLPYRHLLFSIYSESEYPGILFSLLQIILCDPSVLFAFEDTASMNLRPIRDHTSSNIHNGSGRGFIVLRRSPKERLWIDYDPALDDWLGWGGYEDKAEIHCESMGGIEAVQEACRCILVWIGTRAVLFIKYSICHGILVIVHSTEARGRSVAEPA